jgi:uncharacterized caspase-like protein
MLRCLIAFCVVLTGMAGAAGAATEHRYALVIGNDKYEIIQPSLQNAGRDATTIAKALAARGFDVTVKTDVKRRELYQLIDAFAAKISGASDSVGLFYYAGHGIQANGKNYLIPVDADLQSEADLEAEAVDAGKVTRAMDEARNQVNIIILDACRDNPLPKSRSVTRGLVPMQAPRGTFIGYAAAPGQTAQDGAVGTNGVFTANFAKEIAVPGLTIEQVFKRTISGVQANTGGKQVPWMESSLQGDFYFTPPQAVEAPAATAPAAAPVAAEAGGARSTDVELLFWKTIADSKDPKDFEEYLRQFPEGRFSGLAKIRIASLQQPQPATAPEPAAPASPRAASPPQIAAATPPPPLPAEPIGPAVAGPLLGRLRPGAERMAERCGGNSDEAVLAPIKALYEAINGKNIELYAEQWSADSVFRDVYTGAVHSKPERIADRRRRFASWEQVRLTMDSARIVEKGELRAEVEVTYSMMFKLYGQAPRHQNSVAERYTVACYPRAGRWLIRDNVDEINVRR